MAQDVWTFRIVDQDTGKPVSGVPVTVLDATGGSAGYWVSDTDGLVTVPRQSVSRIRLRVGLRSEDPIELETRALSGGPVPLAAPRRGQPVAADPPSGIEVPSPAQSAARREAPAQVLRFVRVGVLPAPGETGKLPALAAGYPAPLRYGVVLLVEQYWEPLGFQSGDLLYSVSLGPGDEAQAAVMDGRWRRYPDARERPLQIVARMIGTGTLGDRPEPVPLESFLIGDLPGAAAETVDVLAERTVRVTENLRRRPLSVSELHGDPPRGTSLRTVRNTRTDGVVTYHFIEPLERYRVIVRTPRVGPAILVPFRLPNLATRDVVRQFGHILKRTILDRAFLPDLDLLLGIDPPRPLAPGAEERFFAHIARNLAYYSAAIIAAGDPAARRAALGKLRDGAGRALTDVIENTVVGRVGNYVAFPLRAAELGPPELGALLAAAAARQQRLAPEFVVTLPVPGVWLKAELAAPLYEEGRAAGTEVKEERPLRIGRKPAG